MHGRQGGRGQGGPGGGPRGAGRRGPRPRRIQRFLEPVVLLALHSAPAHGYGLLEELRALGLEDYPADISAIYRALNSLEEAGMLTSRQESAESGGPPRRVYALTPQGDEYLRAWAEDLRETARLLNRYIAAYDAHRQSHAADEPSPGQPGGQE